jgi:hypothetical protein
MLNYFNERNDYNGQTMHEIIKIKEAKYLMCILLFHMYFIPTQEYQNFCYVINSKYLVLPCRNLVQHQDRLQ